MGVILALDAGTTGVRTFAVDETGRPIDHAYREFPQHFPQPGWVEHDARDIWKAASATLAEVVARVRDRGDTVAGLGITNQRETVVAWSRSTGKPRHRALVWQDRRTATRCDELRDRGLEPRVRELTGLVLDPYFSATKAEWLLTVGGVEVDSDLALGTVDAYLVARLTGGAACATDPSNASRTMLFDIRTREWSDELCDVFGVPRRALPEVRPSSGEIARTDPAVAAGLSVPVCGIAGDQQAALFGQACFTPGMAKNTYGTGSFVLVNLGSECPPPAPGLLTSVGWSLGDLAAPDATTYVAEGSIFVTGAAVQWLRDGLGLIQRADETETLAESVADSGGVVIVPAFTGLGSPYWDPYARGTVLGITRGSGRAQLARAVVESMAWQTRDVVDAITAASGTSIAELRVDGGASAMDLLCRFQADVLGVTVRRPAVTETTALGAAYLAGIARGVWDSPAATAASWRAEAEFRPEMAADEVARRYAVWTRAVERSRGWAPD